MKKRQKEIPSSSKPIHTFTTSLIGWFLPLLLTAQELDNNDDPAGPTRKKE